MTKFQREVLIGLLLGDGFLERRKITHNTILKTCRSSKDKDYSIKTYKIFKNFSNGVKSTQSFDKRTKKIYYRSVFKTRSIPELNKYHENFYTIYFLERHDKRT